MMGESRREQSKAVKKDAIVLPDKEGSKVTFPTVGTKSKVECMLFKATRVARRNQPETRGCFPL